MDEPSKLDPRWRGNDANDANDGNDGEAEPGSQFATTDRAEPPRPGPLPPKGARGKKAPLWVTPFLRALERCGEVRAAAADAGIEHSSAYFRRRTNAGFRAEWKAALERFGDAKSGARAAELAEVMEQVRAAAPDARCVSAPLASASSAAGSGADPQPTGLPAEELAATSAGQLKRVGAGRWSKKSETAFLTELAASGNVRRACAAAGFSRKPSAAGASRTRISPPPGTPRSRSARPARKAICWRR